MGLHCSDSVQFSSKFRFLGDSRINIQQFRTMVLIEGFRAQSACAGPFHHKHHIVHFLQFLQDDETFLIRIFDIVPVFSGKMCQKRLKKNKRTKPVVEGKTKLQPIIHTIVLITLMSASFQVHIKQIGLLLSSDLHLLESLV